MEKSCAIFLKADPLLKRDISTIKTLLKLFSKIYIVLDRKWQKEQYLLSFAERCEIINHDFRENNIENYTILANDTSRYDSVVGKNINTIVFQLTNASDMNEISRRCKLTKKLLVQSNVIMIPQLDENALLSDDYLYDLIFEDQTHQLYKKYISDFAYIKTKFKLMPKIGLTGSKGIQMDVVMDVFRSREYEVVDLGKLISDAFQDTSITIPAFRELEKLKIKTRSLTSTKDGKLHTEEAAVIKLCLDNAEAKEVWFKRIQDYVKYTAMKQILESNRKIIVFSTTLLFELKLDWMFKYIITVLTSQDVARKSLLDTGMSEDQVDDCMSLYLPNADKAKMSDFYIDANGDMNSIIRNTVNVINKKLELNF